MKQFIESSLSYYPTLFKDEKSVIVHLFSTLGNGLKLDNKGYLPENYKGEEPFVFGRPKTIVSIHPWSDTSPVFKKFAGCRDVGFKEAALYFIKCIEITPNSVKNIKKWKENLDVVKEVLINTPTIEEEYPDKEEGYLKFNDKLAEQYKFKKENFDGFLKKKFVLDASYGKCPEFVSREIKQIWDNYDLGNSYYYYDTVVDEELFESFPNIYYWVKYLGAVEGEEILISYSW